VIVASRLVLLAMAALPFVADRHAASSGSSRRRP
jgi:hypothetical protein